MTDCCHPPGPEGIPQAAAEFPFTRAEAGRWGVGMPVWWARAIMSVGGVSAIQTRVRPGRRPARRQTVAYWPAAPASWSIAMANMTASWLLKRSAAISWPLVIRAA